MPGLEKYDHHDNHHLDYHDNFCDHHHLTWARNSLDLKEIIITIITIALIMKSFVIIIISHGLGAALT